MKNSVLATFVLCLCACQGAPAVKRVDIPPANLPPAAAPSQRTVIMENEEATQDFLQLQIERSSDVKPPVEPKVQIVERTVYVDSYGDARPRGPRSTFPIQTAIGAGVGAIIGNQSGDRGEGAAIGAGVGLLLDFMSWR